MTPLETFNYRPPHSREKRGVGAEVHQVEAGHIEIGG